MFIINVLPFTNGPLVIHLDRYANYIVDKTVTISCASVLLQYVVSNKQALGYKRRETWWMQMFEFGGV